MQTAYIGMGSNVASAAGRPDATLAAALRRLSELGVVRRRSSLYSTTPVGNADQPRFVNAAVELETELAPGQLLERLLEIERAFGRDRSSGVQNGPRTLDLDLLLYGSLVVGSAGLTVPHPRMGERAFVLVPLSEIAPDAVEPRTDRSMKELLQRLRSNSPDGSDAVIPIESDFWRAGSGGDAGVGADARNAHG